MKLRSLLAALALVATAACSSEPAQSDRQQIDRDTLTRRQKDSIIAEMPLPGSGVVGRALKVQDAANARAARFDSLAKQGNR
jgi:hypothetical protein